MLPSGQVDNDGVTKALQQYHNRLDRDTGCSPAFMLLGRQLSDFPPSKPGQPAMFFTHEDMSSTWQKIEDWRELALAMVMEVLRSFSPSGP